MGKIKDKSLAEIGKKKLNWARMNMPVLSKIRKRFEIEKPFKNIKISVALHLEKKTGVLLQTLVKGGAQIYACSCNPLSTDDSIAAALSDEIEVFAWSGETQDEYEWCLERVLDQKPDLIIDDGADLINLIHTKYPELINNIIGACEETTTGINRLRQMEKQGQLKFPVIDVNDAYSKHLFDNRFGTGQSTLASLMNITNLNLAGKTIAVFGYGFCGKGISEKLKGIGSKVIVVECFDCKDNFGVFGVHKALEAHMSGFEVLDSISAVKKADIIITATGYDNVVNKREIDNLKDGAILANSGHFDNEINLNYLKEISQEITKINENMEKYILKDGRKIFVLSQGRLVNLARPAGQGHPIEIMDLSFSIQALSCEYLIKENEKRAQVIKVPDEIDIKVAKGFFEII